MIIDIIVIFKYYLIFYSVDNGVPVGGVRIRYSYPNTDTLCYNMDPIYIPLYKLYIIDETIL